jgi:hypothetical protein
MYNEEPHLINRNLAGTSKKIIVWELAFADKNMVKGAILLLRTA